MTGFFIKQTVFFILVHKQMIKSFVRWFVRSIHRSIVFKFLQFSSVFLFMINKLIFIYDRQ